MSQYQLFPDLKSDEYEELKADIAERGVMVPVEYDDAGNVLDGHHREKICRELGIKDYPSIIRYGLSEAEKRVHVRKLNLARRHLNQQQKREIVNQSLLEQPEKSDRQHGRDLNVDHKTVAAARAELEKSGEIPHFSEREDPRTGNLSQPARKPTVFAATGREREKATEPEVAEKIASGSSASVTEAKREIRKDKQVERESSAAADVSNIIVTDDESIVACDAVITDPPYGILDEPWEPSELEHFTREWLSRWRECGADVILAFWSQRHIWDGKRWFDEELEGYAFQQLLVWHYRNNKSPQSRMGFKQTWEPVFFYRRKGCDRQVIVGGGEWGEDLHDFDCHVAAVPQSNFTNAEMKQHPAQKPVSVMRWLVNAVTSPGDLVVDPFCGSGTTGVACAQLGRAFTGIEANDEFRELSRRRIASYGKK